MVIHSCFTKLTDQNLLYQLVIHFIISGKKITIFLLGDMMPPKNKMTILRGSLSTCYFLPCSLCFIYLFLLGPEVCCLPILYFFEFEISIKHFHLFSIRCKTQFDKKLLLDLNCKVVYFAITMKYGCRINKNHFNCLSFFVSQIQTNQDVSRNMLAL